MRPTLRQRFNRTPPFRCRAFARWKCGRRLQTNSDLAALSGLSRSTIAKLSQLKTWDSVPLATIEAFTTACGIDLLAPSVRRDKRLFAGKMLFIENASASQRKMMDRVFRLEFEAASAVAGR